jgi:hypothetical protein
MQSPGTVDMLSWIFVLLFAGSALASCFGPHIEQEDEKQCACPNTCCVQTSKCQVKEKTRMFWEIYNSGTNFDRVNRLFLSNAMINIIYDGCTDMPGCCSQSFPPADALAFFGGAKVRQEVHKVTVKCDGAIIVKSTVIMTIGAPQFITRVYDVIYTWVPSESCDYKLISMEAVSIVCPCDTTLTCAICQAQMAS